MGVRVMQAKQKWILILGLAVIGLLTSGCSSGGGSSYSILPTAQSFTQSVGTVNDKTDVLWVIDNSRSMDPLQNNLTSNFSSFINAFVSKGYDFQMAVTTTDAYLAGPNFNNTPSRAKFRDGVGSTRSGVFVMLPTTLNLSSVFLTNASQGGGGSGDERAFSSMKAALGSSLNAGFLRPNAFLAVIILSDEDDFSDPNRPEASWQYFGGVRDHSYTNPGLETVSSYMSYLDSLTGSSATIRRYSVSAISVLDSACLASHIANSTSSIIGQRYMDFANATNGVLGSICGSFAANLLQIQEKILELGTQFYLDRAPIVSSIRVFVNGSVVTENALNGWTYNAIANSIVFHGAAVPPSNASIQVAFDPQNIVF